MAGHSHSANIAVRKGAQDKARGKLFTKLSKEIMVAVKLGGEDPDSNSRLRLALAKARSNSVPKDTIKRGQRRWQIRGLAIAVGINHRPRRVFVVAVVPAARAGGGAVPVPIVAVNPVTVLID